jgi:hypothetical protein
VLIPAQKEGRREEDDREHGVVGALVGPVACSRTIAGMPEGLSATEVGKETVEHASHAHAGSHERRDRLISISEAVLLSLVTLAAAYSGFAAAKWSTDSSVTLAKASADRAKANRADLDAREVRNLDSVFFNAWLGALSTGNEELMRIAERRFRPGFRVAFDAWRATNPETNPHAPRGPTYMPQYKQPKKLEAIALDAQATATLVEGASAGATSDKYIRTTVLLATVLFLVGISTHFPLRGVRYGLIGLGTLLLVVSVAQLLQLPRPPS